MAFAVILSVFTLASAAVFMSLSATLQAAEQNNVSNLNIQDVATVLYQSVEQQNAARGFAATRNADFLNNYEKDGALADKSLAASHGDFSVKAVRRRPMFCIEGLDQRTAWVLPRVAGPNGVSQDPLHALQVGDPRSDVCQVRSSEGSHLGARGLSSTGKAQEGAHLV